MSKIRVAHGILLKFQGAIATFLQKLPEWHQKTSAWPEKKHVSWSYSKLDKVCFLLFGKLEAKENSSKKKQHTNRKNKKCQIKKGCFLFSPLLMCVFWGSKCGSIFTKIPRYRISSRCACKVAIGNARKTHGGAVGSWLRGRILRVFLFFFRARLAAKNPHGKNGNQKKQTRRFIHPEYVYKFHEKTTKGIKAFFNEISQKHILSFWGKRPIFRGKLAVGSREGRSLFALVFCLFANHSVSKIAERWLKKHLSSSIF